MNNATRLCETKPIVTINGKFPGPTLYAREDDTLLIKVVNHVKYNVSIHWHGIRQLRSGWADGSAYITSAQNSRGKRMYILHTYRPKRNTLVVCTHSVVEGYCPWWYCHLAKTWCNSSLNMCVFSWGGVY